MAGQRSTDGWSDVLGDADNERPSPPSERRGGHPPSSADARPGAGGVSRDPVQAAMAELEQSNTIAVEAQPKVSPSPASSDRSASAGRPRRGTQRSRRPAAPPPTGFDPSQEQTVVAFDPRMSQPGSTALPGARLTLPRPDAEPRSASPAPPEMPPDRQDTPPLMKPAGIVAPDFSSEGLVERLNESAANSSMGDDGDRRSYRELALTIAAVVVCFVGAIVYQLWPTGEKPSEVEFKAAPAELTESTPTPVPPPPTVRPPPRRAAPTGRSRAQPATRGRRPSRERAKAPSATPMLSIVTTPSGAIVDIDGVVYGRTPLIMPSPRNESSLSVTLKKPGHKTHAEVLTRNEAGHFSLNVKLKPSRLRQGGN